jgi:hypothetical protein
MNDSVLFLGGVLGVIMLFCTVVVSVAMLRGRKRD